MKKVADNGRSNGKYKGVRIRADLRLAIYLRDGFTCLYCCKNLHDAKPFDITLDHLIPDSKGGSNDPKNLITACRACNCSRRDLPLSRFAGPETRKHIQRNRNRSINRYRILAKALIAGESNDPQK